MPRTVPDRKRRMVRTAARRHLRVAVRPVAESGDRGDPPRVHARAVSVRLTTAAADRDARSTMRPPRTTATTRAPATTSRPAPRAIAPAVGRDALRTRTLIEERSRPRRSIM
jgi:hypothetical protein